MEIVLFKIDGFLRMAKRLCTSQEMRLLFSNFTGIKMNEST
ncbi:hypothetical protein T11_1772 [Trichinella zimbabwensis]|uniref:Uncharacterized protein n=1 Tax=Trichinella zimbabwensis TaxID=268475 RepID=A0A0V1HWI2_9BILA|nr:hypothetical protein T11_1772 [Trichinella zimbabwensis]